MVVASALGASTRSRSTEEPLDAMNSLAVLPVNDPVERIRYGKSKGSLRSGRQNRTKVGLEMDTNEARIKLYS